MQNHNKIYMGFFPDLYDQTLLISGSSKSLMILADIFQKIADGEVSTFSLHQQDYFLIFDGTKVCINALDSVSRIKKLTNNEFNWNITRALSAHFFNLIMALIANEKPCHQYLECESDEDITIIVSKDEYEKSFFMKKPD